MFQLYSKKSLPLLGIDIGSTSIKIIELGQNSGRFRVENYIVEPLPPNAVVEKEIKAVEEVGQAIARAIKKAKFKTEFAAAAVAGSAVITKIIQLPANMQDHEMESQIDLEADRHIPYPLEEVNRDFEVLGPCVADPNYVDVLLACSRRENVDLRVDALEIGGLKAKVVDIEAYTIERAYQLIAPSMPQAGDNQTIAVIDIGATMTTLNVVHNHQIIYTREQVFGGKQLTEEIQRRYDLTFEQAYVARDGHELPEDFYSEVLEPFKEAVAQQISRSLQFFFSSSEYSEIHHLVLAGGTAAIANISTLVEAKVGTQVSIANPFEDMAVSKKVNTSMLHEDASALMICCGLAMRSFD